jgi:hypothetical protein
MIPLTYLLLIIPMLLLQGYVVSYLWEWFITPVFGLPVLTQLQACGIALLSKSLKYISVTHVPPKDEQPPEWFQMAAPVLGMLMLLGLGYIVKFWLM